MTNIKRGLCWAAAIILLAIAKQYRVVDAEAANTLILVLPIVAVLSLRSRRECSLPRKMES